MKPRVYYRSRHKDFVAYLNLPLPLGKVVGWSGTSAKLAIADCQTQARRMSSLGDALLMTGNALGLFRV